MSLAEKLIAEHGVTPCQAAIIAALYRARSWVAADRLNAITADASALFDHAAPLRDVKTVTVHIVAIRKRFGDDVILSYWGRGYTLGAPGVLLCRRLAERVAA